MKWKFNDCGLVVQRFQEGSPSTVARHLRQGVGRGELVQLYRGLYCHASYWNARSAAEQRHVEMVGLSLLYPRHAVTDRAGATMYGLPVYGAVDELILEAPIQTRMREYKLSSGRKVVLRRTPRYRKHLRPQIVRQVRVADPVAVLCCVLKRAATGFKSQAEVLAILDAAFRENLVPSLRSFGFLKLRNRARRNLQRLAGMVSRKSESPLESATKLWLRDRNYVQQAVIHDGQNFVARVDFLLPEEAVVLECDGKVKYQLDPARIWTERKRESAITNLGFRVVHVTWADVFYGNVRKLLDRAELPKEQMARFWCESNYRRQ